MPEWLDYVLWQGPAPERPFRDNILHYNWHWFWHWGTGELGNNGIHALDLARWGLGVDCPRRVTCGGNRYHFKDDQETPDIAVAMFDFGDKGIAWEGRSCDPRGFEGEKFGVSFHGEKGSLVLAGTKCKIYDLNDKPVREISGQHDDVRHFGNFIDGIREGRKLNAEIQKAWASCLNVKTMAKYGLGSPGWFDPPEKNYRIDRPADWKAPTADKSCFAAQ